MGAVKRTTLLDLAQNFDRYMFDRSICGSPIAKGFTINAAHDYYGTITDDLYWYILDVREDGTYPVVSDDGQTLNFPQLSEVTIHHIDNL